MKFLDKCEGAGYGRSGTQRDTEGLSLMARKPVERPVLHIRASLLTQELVAPPTAASSSQVYF